MYLKTGENKSAISKRLEIFAIFNANTCTLSTWIKDKDKILDGDRRYECIKVAL